MILLILSDGSPFLIIGNFIEGIIFIMITLPPTTRNVDSKSITPHTLFGNLKKWWYCICYRQVLVA